MDKIKEAYEEAVRVLEKCSTKKGFYAAYPGYQGVWGRDSMITSLGAGLVGERFKNVIEMSFDTLAENQSKKGQISNAVIYNGKKKVDYKSIDSSLWFIIGYHTFLNRFNNRNLF